MPMVKEETVRITSTLPIVGKVSVNFYDTSATVIKFYEKINELQRQKETKHLGLISKIFEGASHSRYEYVMLQSCLSELLDNIYKGSATAAQGSIKIDGADYTGNGVLKSWFLLSNLGHTKNTIGDEKSLMIFSLKQPGFRSCLLNPIKDTLLREWANKTIDEFNYIDFHHIIAIRRIYKEQPRNTKNQCLLVKLYKILLLDINNLDIEINKLKLEQLRRIFRTIRALSIAAIDGHHSHSPVNVDITSIILSLESVEHTYTGKFLFDSITPVLSCLHEDIYLDKNVLAAQREYELQALKWLNEKQKNAAAYEEIIKFSLTNGLITQGSTNLSPFARLAITEPMQPDTKFYDELRNIQTVKKRCRGVEASLDYNPVTKVRYADFFIHSNDFSQREAPRFVFNISSLISNQIKHLYANSGKEFFEVLSEAKENAILEGVDEQAITKAIQNTRQTISRHIWKAFRKDILPAFKDLFWSILKYFIGDKYHIDIDSENKNYDVFGMRHPAGDFGLLEDNIKTALTAEKNDPDRAHELQQLLKASKRAFDGYIFVCLSRIRIYDLTKPPSERLVSDIDSLIIKVNKNKLILELNESKNIAKRREAKAVKELRSNLAPVLNKNAKGYRVMGVKGFGGKLVIKCEKQD